VSAPPDSEDAARLPFLITGTPAAPSDGGHRRQVHVLIVTPGPTMSTASPLIEPGGIRRACCAWLSQFVDLRRGRPLHPASPTANPEIFRGVADPFMIWSIAHADWPGSRSDSGQPAQDRGRWALRRRSLQKTRRDVIRPCRTLPRPATSGAGQFRLNYDPGGVGNYIASYLHL
jgi:hypothetical protein